MPSNIRSPCLSLQIRPHIIGVGRGLTVCVIRPKSLASRDIEDYIDLIEISTTRSRFVQTHNDQERCFIPITHDLNS